MKTSKPKKNKAPTTVKEALRQCRAAFRKHPKATHAWCCHHEVLLESLSYREGVAEGRIRFILANKDSTEHVARFNNFRPFTGQFIGDPVNLKVKGVVKKQLEKDVPYSTWSFRRRTIF